MKKILAGLGMAALGLSFAAPANADVIGFGGTDGDRAAEVYFEINGDTLTITLTNTGANDVLVPIDVLTAVYFDLTGSPDLTPVSAILADGSFIIYDTDTDDVGTEWAHVDTSGVSSTGVGIFGPGDRFVTAGDDLAGPDSPNGLQYGIVTASDDDSTGNGGITGSGGLINNSVVFTLTGVEGLTIDDISNIIFQYGTALEEPQIGGDCITCEEGPKDPVAEPATLALFGLGLAGLAKRAAGKK